MPSKQLQVAWLPQDSGSWQATPPPAFLSGLWFHFPSSPGASVPSLPAGSLSPVVGVAEATGPPRSTALGLGVPEKPIGLAWVGVSALSTPLGEAGHMVSGTGWEAVLGTAATMRAAFLMRGMFWGRMGKWGVTLLESSWCDGRGRPIADLPKGHRIRSGIPWEKLEFADLTGGRDGCAPGVSPALAWS